MIGNGYTDRELTHNETIDLINQALDSGKWEDKKILLIIPDSTRSAPVDVLYKAIYEKISEKTACIDALVALGTHQPMSQTEIFKRVGITKEEYEQKYSEKTQFFNHAWDDPDTLIKIGKISADEVRSISGGLMDREVEITINKLIFEYDHLMILGPVFPHESVGFSGGNKYFFPGICGEEIIEVFHWLGALITNAVINGKKETPVRKIINKAAGFIDMPRIYFHMVVKHGTLHGLYIGDGINDWGRACDLSSEVNINYVKRRYKKVLGITPLKYDEIWTAGKVAYKAETIVEDGGDLIIYAPHITEISFTHGKYIEKVGYHVRDYFATRMDMFKDVSDSVLSHAITVKGTSSFENNEEKPRINVVLATGISEEKCEKINLGYLDPSEIKVEEWENREEDGILVIHDAGEVLYKVK